MIRVEVPAGLSEARLYAIDVVLRHFLGLPFQVDVAGRSLVRLHLNDSTAIVEIPDVFFDSAAQHWLRPESLPQRPFAIWRVADLECERLVDRSLPVLFGEGTFSYRVVDGVPTMRLPVDVFGTAFFMLTRYEEVVLSPKDRHDRFPTGASVLAESNVYHRPLVDEYVEILWSAIARLQPSLRRKKLDFAQVVSCDVDAPFDMPARSLTYVARQALGDVLKRRAPSLMYERLRYRHQLKTRGLEADRQWQFDWMMDACEAHDTQCAFNFLTVAKHPLDGDHYWGKEEIDTLLQRIHARGHEIGLHASYTSYDSPQQTRLEFEILQQSCEQLGIRRDNWGGRQHYLRWKAPLTWRNWAGAGLDYDSTVGFADIAGFRCGTCRRYPVFDVVANETLPLNEQPLAVMEVALFDPHRSTPAELEQAVVRTREIKAIVGKLRGDFAVLWHNTSLTDDALRRAYVAVLD